MSRISSANAAAMAARSAQVRRERAEAAKQARDVAASSVDSLAYVALRLARVRRQLDRLDEMMMTEKDAQKLDRLASAQLKVSEQERIADGRPLPGSRRPGKEAAPQMPEVEPL